MVLPILGGLASLGLALPTGLAFGWGYGYGVRMGYSAFKPSKNNSVESLRLSANPVDQAKGAGLFSAEEITGHSLPEFGATDDPSLKRENSKILDPSTQNQMIDMNKVRSQENPYSDQHLIHSPYSRREIPFEDFKTRRDFQLFVKKGIIPPYLSREPSQHRYTRAHSRN